MDGRQAKSPHLNRYRNGEGTSVGFGTDHIAKVVAPLPASTSGL
jgi:hypothetical protein